MSDDGATAVELPQLWQYVHPGYTRPDGAEEAEEEAEEEEEEESTRPAAFTGERPADYVKLSRRAPRLGQLVRYLNDMEDEEEAQAALLERDPVTQQTLLQWATLNGHYTLVEYLVKRLQRAAFGFDPEAADVVVYNRWEEMRPELPTAAEVAERQRQREQERAEARAARAAEGDDDEEAEEEEEEENEPTPEELVYEQLEEYHDEWGDRGVGVVKRIGELGVFVGARLRDGTKQGLGQSLYPNGDCYAGEYRENQRHGAGTYWWSATAQVYCGQWSANARHGYGRMVYPDGSRYLGFWSNNVKSGQGRYTYADGSSYDGTWANNEKHGAGRYQFTDGSCYVGSFFHGSFVSGEWRLASGRVKYVGNFERDVPVGAGVFVHRCGAKEGTFQQEGTFRDGRWVPSVLKGSSRLVPRLELIAPQQPRNARVPIEFGEDSNGRTMADLVRAANFPPLLRWVRALPPTGPDDRDGAGVELRAVAVSSMRYDPADPTRVVEVRIRPTLASASGGRVGSEGGVDTLTLVEPATRLLVLLEEAGRAGEAGEGVVLLERALRYAAGGPHDEGHMQYRLPTVTVSEDGAIGGSFARLVGPALRLDLSRRNTRELIPALNSNPLTTNATESARLYAQTLHPDAFAGMQEKLDALAAHPELLRYEAVPLHRVLELSSDAMTVVAAASVAQRRSARTLPQATVGPQRAPTPPPPAPEERPPLQPLYDARAARDAAEAEEEDDDQ